MMTSRLVCLVLAAISTLGCYGQIVQNGSFEQGFKNWTYTNAVSIVDKSAWPDSKVPDGRHCVSLGGGGRKGGVLFQIIQVEPNTDYLLSFQMAVPGIPGKTSTLKAEVCTLDHQSLASQEFIESVDRELSFSRRELAFCAPAGVQRVVVLFNNVSKNSEGTIDCILDKIEVSPAQIQSQIPPIQRGKTTRP